MVRQGSTGNGATAVRFGGVQTPDGFLFELTGGHLCLDFANTLDDRPLATPRELLTSYEDLVAWGLQAGAVDESVARTLRRAAKARPRVAAQALYRARILREALYAIFSAAAASQPPPADAIKRLNASLAPALAARRLELGGGRAAWTFVERDPPNLDRAVWPAVISAAKLLTSDDVSRVRWCDMTVCGNRSKARRHYSRSHGQG
jgi:predicted RNA-binding Zn ribbon-like protein